MVGGDLSNSNVGEIRMNSSLPNIDRPKNSTPIIDLDEVISHEGGGRALEDDDDDEFEIFDVKKGLAAQAANIHQLEVINDELNGGQGTRSAIEGGPRGKVVSKTNNSASL
jgi:hypothetical protein